MVRIITLYKQLCNFVYPNKFSAFSALILMLAVLIAYLLCIISYSHVCSSLRLGYIVVSGILTMSIKYINKKGEFQRKDSQFRSLVTGDGSSGFKAEAGRYHLYVSLACPWAHRTLIMRRLKGLEDIISVDVVDWFLSDKGWQFSNEKLNCTTDSVNNCNYISEIYHKANPDYSVPILWDKQESTIVNNESSEIIRMLNSEFNNFCKTEEQKKLNFYPEDLRDRINEISVEYILSQRRYLTGSRFTEADIRLFTTLVRFDWVYHGHFKCNKKMLKEYPNIWGYTREIYQMEGVADTVDREHIRRHYHESHASINPHRITPIGADLDFMEPHAREKIGND